MKWLDSITDLTNMNFSKLWEIIEDRGAWHAVVHGVAKGQTLLTTEQQQITNAWEIHEETKEKIHNFF